MTAPGQPQALRPRVVRPLMRRPGNSRAVRAVAVTVALALSAAAGWGEPRWWALPLAVAGFATGSWLGASSSVSSTRWASAPVDAVAGLCLALDPGAWLVLCALLGVTLSQAVRDVPLRRATHTVTRTMAAAAAGAAAGVAVTRLGATPSTAAGCGLAAWWVTGHALSVLAVSRTTGRSARRLFLGRAGATLPGALLGAALGVTSAWLVLHAPAGLLGLTAPVVLVITSQLHGVRTMAETQILRELLGAQSGRRADPDRPGRRSMDDSVQLLLTSAARLLGGADVEVLALGVDGALRYAGRERGDAARTRVLPAAYDEPWVRRSLAPTAPGTSARARRGVDGGRPVLAVRLGPGGSTGAVLVARRLAGAARFSRGDMLIAEALAARTAGWLPTALVGSEPVAEEEQPQALTLSAVRASAARMARITDPRSPLPGRRVDLDAVVDELRELERAVAALLGDRSLPPEASAEAAVRIPEARSPGPPGSSGAPGTPGAPGAPAAVTDADAWTTSGTMRAGGWV